MERSELEIVLYLRMGIRLTWGSLTNPRNKDRVNPEGWLLLSRREQNGPVPNQFYKRIHKDHTETAAGRLYYKAYIFTTSPCEKVSSCDLPQPMKCELEAVSLISRQKL